MINSTRVSAGSGATDPINILTTFSAGSRVILLIVSWASVTHLRKKVSSFRITLEMMCSNAGLKSGKTYDSGKDQPRATTSEDERSLADHAEKAENRNDWTIYFTHLSKHQSRTVIYISAE
jgi:ATP-dependent Clp protease ATP-binding subunit ClpA